MVEKNTLTDAVSVAVYLLECECATLEYLNGLKRAPKSDVRRHQAIIKRAVIGLAALNKADVDVIAIAEQDGCTRAAEAILALSSGG